MFSNIELCNLIPHSGKMCLLDTVKQWNSESIICTTQTHQKNDNPLRNNGSLPVSALIEYGAQAMAVHGALIAKDLSEKMQEGYLAALKEVNFYQNFDINNITSPLMVKATRKFASQGNMIYEFSVASEDNELISGRATVVAIFNN
ncbi:3-hydroxydecanoyl-[ACP] dehydratase (EC 4.2.1.59) [uncultured Gammaproteobacteria bacterium]|jgi:predicted hotdog family 3-hydroxylacyl-ACP dehydratase|nr:3-hydroxydecanoyl-[ACP] dehydratase (EC 4.2.1.59) [uncultured Gammaproteobacteria bacterium]CAC9602304.1 3-hydroxydecanoyl-[ACP] dehydratase (EC 4.2.1.59) [uncultured Gammaproteobacteria bacterium]CAC9629537.1 3-hydroxydecanoyl-[ACP] dehydratase (EC 4.2.1.59) [uncultured Gammaproteobacteria bacterium]CAC9631090.1 3-hydroxydecanoyl-[ACP] dehydratase (EC 4.2.1.59) [uncultured Gammaproteobacteria bacterium]VVH51311.1 3-hydroxydecanoyl-[ACP] dehydratase (EC [uncultured Gammaproteobacteria bacter